MRTLRLTCLILASALATGCTKHESPDDKMVLVGLSAPPASLDPRLATDATGERISRLLYSSLVHFGADLKPEGEDAQSWTQTETSYRFVLKPHLSFSNGREVTPEDVDFSVDTYRGPKSFIRLVLFRYQNCSVEARRRSH